MKKTVLGLTALGLLAAAGFAWYSSLEKPVAVTVIKPERGTVMATVSNTRAGTVNTCNRARISPITGGQIVSLEVKTGDHVKAGQQLLTLWNEDTKATLSLALMEKEASIALAEQSCASSQVATREANRFAKLSAENMVSDEQADLVEGEARSKAAACRAKLKMVEVSNAQIQYAEAQLAKTILRAPFAGTVAEINGEVGEVVTASPVGVATLPAIDLIDDSCTYVSAPIDEVDAPLLQAGMPASISLDAFPGQSYSASVRRVAPYVLDLEKQARTVEIEVEFEESSTELLPGYSADVEVIIDKHENTLKIPSQALVDKNSVLIITGDGVLETRSVVTGLKNWQETEILEGVTTDDTIVLSVNREGVAAGAKVTIEQDQLNKLSAL